MSGLFGDTPRPPTVPTMAAPAPIPDPNSPAVLEARRNAQNKLLQSAGRSSTILTTPGNRGGGGGAKAPGTIAGSGAAYSGNTLGGAS